jgi:predicted GNAT superfamily acetyltransferase
MNDHDICPVTPADMAATSALGKDLLALNNAHAQELSWLDPERLAHLLKEAFLARRIGRVDAFLLAFDQDAAYDSPNYLWFRSRYARFVYVDRIVVAPGARGRGYARRLYDGLFAQASRAGHERVVCEVNADPPNPASDAFHAALGFAEIGTAVIHGGSKTVRYFSRPLSSGVESNMALGGITGP